jgi:integrase
MRGCIIKPTGRRKSWSVRLYVIDPQTGAKHRQWFSFPTRTEAEAHLADMLAKIHGGGTVPVTRQTVAEFLRTWLDKRAGAVRETSHESYGQIVNGHLIPALGQAPLRGLTPLAVQGYITTKLAGRKDTQGKWTAKPLAAGTVRKHLAVLREALGHAVKWGLLARNICDLVEKPRVARTDMHVWDQEQTQVFLAEAKRSSAYFPLYLTAVSTGMRAGELLGLRWSSIDFLFGTAHVERTFYRMGGKQLFQEPKTDKGRRVVDLLPTVVEVLRELKAKQDALKREIGSMYTDLGLVFCQPDGKPLHLCNIARRDFQRVTKKAKLPRIRFHDLRHSHATDLLAHGEHPKVVQERLGHYDPAFTLRIYSHVLPGMQAQAAARLETRLFGTVVGAKRQE